MCRVKAGVVTPALYPAFSFVLRRAPKPAQNRPKSPGGAGTLLGPKPLHTGPHKGLTGFSLLSFVLLVYFPATRCGRDRAWQLPVPKTALDIFSIASYDHDSKATSCKKRPRLRPMSGAGDLTNTLTNIRISAGGHSRL